MESKGPEVHTLVVRLWREHSKAFGEEGEWRGEIKPVPGKDVIYFRGMDGMVEVIESLADAQGPSREHVY